ncbi:MAG: hypothetical protein SRB2_00588 [Desulfobacteraceae bacterium Eth-SRB2]|nr:MAG: hypothetical protein SRB2_00588 [Desulfobacteraceae bacterium Eth-SRB2]
MVQFIYLHTKRDFFKIELIFKIITKQLTRLASTRIFLMYIQVHTTLKVGSQLFGKRVISVVSQKARGIYMNADKKIISRLVELIERGLEIEKTKEVPPPNCIGFDSTVDSQAANQWHASAKNILAKAFSRDSEHFKLFEECCKDGVTFSPLHEGIGILNAAKEDFEHGYIQDVRNLVAAEMFSDLLDQASELLEAGYHGPAAVLSGAVLEDNLQKICEIKDIELPQSQN